MTNSFSSCKLFPKKMFNSQQQQQRWYERKTLIEVEEDEYNEFKGHRNLAVEELPPWCFQKHSDRRSRKAVSRAINAFLNSGRGGTVYLGITDDGVVKGLYLTEYQIDHVIVSLKDLFSRYTPPVCEEKYEITFVPVFGTDEAKNLQNIQQKLDDLKFDKHLQPHLVRTYDFCWCDKDLAIRLDKNDVPRDYVIEIKLLPQKGKFKSFEDGMFCVDLPFIHANEEGNCYFRKSASCVEYSLESIRDLTIQQVNDVYEPIIERLQNEIKLIVDTLENGYIKKLSIG